jgi:peptidoglycan hydrolase-like protein with peptidoglycan-binding domain
MRTSSRFATGVAALVVGVAVALVPTGPAQAATPHCNAQTNIQSRVHPDIYVFAPFWFDPPRDYTGTFNCLLSQGDRGDGVLRLQMSMNWCYGKHLTEDGDFGPLTRSALVSVQRTVGTSADGVYGPKTRAKMKHFGDIFTRNCEYVS